MGSGNYESQILEAIQILVDNAVSKANYDKTIQGTISRCVDATIGKYIVKYQDSSFYAYSHNTETKYTAGTGVYILVPGNDMSKEKSIIGTVEHLGPDYVSIIEGENGYEVTGVNTINTDGTFGLCSYKNEDMKILYDRDNDVDLLGLDVFGLENYIKQSNSIICGATFKTALDSAQKYRGDYGIVFHLDFIDKSTGETVTKSYIVNVDQMTGNPYNYTVASRQYGIFDVDGANFISVKQVYIFAYDFPNAIEGKENDIFVSKVELSAANALEKEAAATCALTFVTPQGTYFDENDLDSDTRTLQAQIRIKGEAIDNDSQNIEYYWFRENNNISPKSEKYNQYGGTGWECLNAYSVIQAETADSEAVVQWTHGDYQYVTKKENNVARETTYKCVAVYTDGTILSKTIVIYNYSSNYEITIQSDSGVAFNYDVGKPTLTCLVNGKEESSDTYKYVWSVINSSNQLSILEETTVNNDDYNTAVAAKAALLEKIEAEQLMTAADQEALQVYTQTIDQYEYIMRVEKNKIHNLKISSITKFSTYKCSVYKSGVAIGTASIIITNTQEKDVDYTLVVENGNQVFKYNEKGISPASQSNDKPITILPLSFTLYDDKGQKINHNVIDEIEWKVAKTDTMLNIALSHGNGTENADGTLSYYNDPELSFSINPAYDVKKDKNEIQLVIKYNDKVISAKTNFTFVKEGEASTNGTDFICKIVPNGIEGDIVPRYPVVTYNNHTAQYSLNYTPKKADTWFKVQLWHDGELIFEGTQTGKTIEDQVANVKWSMLQNNYGNRNKDESNFTINSDTAAITFNTEDLESPANIVKAVVNYNNIDYYATLPIAIVKVKNEDYDVQIPDSTGFRHVMYTTDGRSPAYDNQPFELIVSQIVEGVKNDISNFSSSEFAVDYDWNVCGKVYYSQWQSESNLITNTYLKTEKRNQKIFKPIDTYNGLCVNNAIICNITRGAEQIAVVHIPVHFYINRYGNAAINGWDGNSITLDEQGGIILSPQVGAGKKNEDNSFTGVFMGSVKEPGAEQEEHGLFGYNAGQRTISLNSEDGSARFGKTGAGQIIIDPTTGAAQLKSGNYIPAKLDENGNIIESGSGMLIDLTEPTIDFGTGGFRVDKDGQVHALGYATINDLSKTKEEIEESVTIFDVITNTSSLAIPVNTSNKPLYNTTYEVSYYGIFKGKQLNAINIGNPNGQVQGISINIIEQGKIKFTVNTNTAIQNLVTDFTFNFSYSTDGKLYETSKQISLALAAQGADGQPGKDGENGAPGQDGKDGDPGKSAYELWLDAGNTGTEEDYLNSLKGKDGEDGKEGPQGPQGEPGKDGQDGDIGKSAYQVAVDKGFEGTEEEWLQSLIGEDGKDGQPGAPGENGKTSYLHIAYANSADGTQDFSTTDSANKLYIGQYTDFEVTDSTTPSKYSWTLIKGDKGADAKEIAISASALNFTSSKINSWFGAYNPNETNTDPTKQWITDEDKEQHLGDLFGEMDSEETILRYYRYCYENNMYKWVVAEEIFGSEETAFNPIKIVLKPELKNITYQKWEYFLISKNQWAEIDIVKNKDGQTIPVNSYGRTAYEDAVFHGYLKTEEEWIQEGSITREEWTEDLQGVKTSIEGVIFNIENNSLIIRYDSELFTDYESVVSFKCIASDNNYSDTISISKIKNNDLSEMQVLYAITETSEAPAESSELWQPYLEDTVNKFIWQRIDKYFANGVVEIGMPTCLTFSATSVVQVQVEYGISTGTSLEDGKQISEWLSEKPIWNEKYYIWSRQKTVFSNGVIDYSNYICDTESHTVQNKITQMADSIFSDLRTNGIVKLEFDQIRVMNNADEEKATQILRINTDGIGFAKKLEGETLTDEHYTSVWGLDGVFDAKDISVINLTADTVQNGILRLYDTEREDIIDGKLLIFKDNVHIGDIKEIEAQDHEALVELSSNGIEVKLAGGMIFRVHVDRGLEIVSADGTKTVCKLSQDKTSIEITKIKIVESIDFGEKVRGVVMEQTLNGKKHKGLGFIKI